MGIYFTVEKWQSPVIFYLCSNFKHIFLSYRYICTDAFKEFPLKSKRKCAFPISSGSSIFNCVSTMIFMLFRVVSISRGYWFSFVYYCDKNLTNEPLVSNGLPCKIISCFCKVIYDFRMSICLHIYATYPIWIRFQLEMDIEVSWTINLKLP